MSEKIENKDIFLNIVNKNIKRDGIKNLIKFLEDSDFFTAPASANYHSNEVGGLLKHSLAVYKYLVEKSKFYKLDYPIETLSIVGLFHDLCKINFYKIDDEEATEKQIGYLKSLIINKCFSIPDKCTKKYASLLIEYFKNDNSGDVPKEESSFVIDDKFPLGHGEKSLYFVGKYIDLTEDEALAIRWHMNSFDVGNTSKYSLEEAKEKSKLVNLLISTDSEVSSLLKI